MPRSSLLRSSAVLRSSVLASLGAGLLVAFASPAAAQLSPPPAPPGNPVTPEKAKLGKVLFWDEQLSSTRTVACGTCHFPSTGGDDSRSATSPLALHPGVDGVFGTADDAFGSPGVPSNLASGDYVLDPRFGLREQTTRRRTGSSINAGYSNELFWDGRAPSRFVDPQTQIEVLPFGAALESQAVGPPGDSVEMGHAGRDWDDVTARIGASEPLAVASHVPPDLLRYIDGRDYAALFEEAFGSPGIDAPRVAMAIATYERTQFTNRTPFDAFLAGDSDALTAEETLGRNVFLAASCDRCHQREIMSDHLFHYIGSRAPEHDEGRFEVTGDPQDRAKMRTPSLRNVELRAPYMHHGQFATLEEVVDFYDRGGDFDAPNKDPLVRPLDLDPSEKAALVAFLKRPLTDPRLAPELAPFDRPTLYTETQRVPAVESSGGLAGPSGVVPVPVALEPAYAGNPSFTVGVYDVPPGAQAWLVIDATDPGTTRPGSAAFAYEAVTAQDDGAGNGFASASVAVPATGAGGSWVGRWYVTDGGAEAASPAFRFPVFPPLAETVVFADAFESGTATAWSVVVD